jgi:hypothetical protein
VELFNPLRYIEKYVSILRSQAASLLVLCAELLILPVCSIVFRSRRDFQAITLAEVWPHRAGAAWEDRPITYKFRSRPSSLCYTVPDATHATAYGCKARPPARGYILHTGKTSSVVYTGLSPIEGRANIANSHRRWSFQPNAVIISAYRYHNSDMT